MNLKKILNNYLGCDLFDLKPSHIDNGVSYYTDDSVTNLVNTIFPVKITNKTNDSNYHWSNDTRYVNLLERIIGRIKPTHNLILTPVNEEYRFDCVPR